MQRTLRTNSRITPEIHAEAAAEIHAYFCGNLSTFRQELLDDATNAKFLKSVEDAETLFELGDDPDEEELKDLGQFRDFSSKWVRTALIPTVIERGVLPEGVRRVPEERTKRLDLFRGEAGHAFLDSPR